MPIRSLMLVLLGAASLSQAAFAQENQTVLEVDGSSGKYFGQQDAACSAAQSDARLSAESECERSGGRTLDDPILASCSCDQGGFEEKEWLCSTRITLTCAMGETPVAPATTEATMELDRVKVGKLDEVALFDRAFARRGYTLPPDDLAKRFKQACDSGWAIGCEVSAWAPKTSAERAAGGQYLLSKARNPLKEACDRGDDASCLAWGWATEEKGLAASDGSSLRSAARTYKSLCDKKKNATACYDYGTILFNQLGVSSDPRLGIRRWESACDAGSSAACAVLAKVYRLGLKTRANPKKALSFAKRSCAGGETKGCLEQAILDGDKAAVALQPLQMCRNGSVSSCAEVAAAYESGEQLEPKEGAKRALLSIGCELGDDASCTQSGEAAMNEGDDEGAAVQFRAACKRGRVDSCTKLVDMVLTERTTGTALEERDAFEVACSRGEMSRACSQLGLAMIQVEGDAADPIRARALLRQGCTDERSPAKSCFVLGDLYETGKGGERDRTLSARYYKWACAQGWGEACERRGHLLAQGVGVRRDEGEAVVSYQAGCDAGLAEACFNGGVLLDEGTAIARDPERALKLFDQACERAVAPACLRRGNLLLDSAVGQDPAAARNAYEDGIRHGDVESHRRLAYLLWNGIGGKKDKKRAKSLTVAGCKAADAIACRGPSFQTAP